MTDGTDLPKGASRRQALEQDLKATSDAIQSDVDRIADIEARKRALPPGDPEVDRLSEAAVAAADRLALEARAERQLAEELR